MTPQCNKKARLPPQSEDEPVKVRVTTSIRTPLAENASPGTARTLFVIALSFFPVRAHDTL